MLVPPQTGRRRRVGPALAAALAGLAVAALPVDGCGDSGRPTGSNYDRSFMSRCEKDGDTASYCSCALADAKGLAAEAGVAPHPFSRAEERATGADRDCR
jgi:hypothetical protein